MAFEFEPIAKPSISGGGRARAFKIMVDGSERITYAPPRRPRSFAEIGKSAPAPTKVIPFTMPFTKPSRRVETVAVEPAAEPAPATKPFSEDDLPAFMRE